MHRVLGSAAAVLLLGAAPLPSSPQLGTAAGRCRINERGPAYIVSVEGLKDRKGRLRLEVYPSNDEDFLADDNVLVAAGKTFRRVDVPVPQSGPVDLCIRTPASGTYAVSLLHDRDADRKFGWRGDGIGFAGNPRLGWSKPEARSASVVAGEGPTPLDIVLNYQRGLAMKPIHGR